MTSAGRQGPGPSDPAADVVPIADLSGAVGDADRTVLLGAPGIGKSRHLDDVDDALVVSVTQPALDGPAATEQFGDVVVDDREEFDLTADDGPLVLDDFYDLLMWYRTGDTTSGARAAFGAQVADTVDEADRPVVVCTTPYRLDWLLREYADGVEELLGDHTDWTYRAVAVDETTAEERLAEVDGVDASARAASLAGGENEGSYEYEPDGPLAGVFDRYSTPDPAWFEGRNPTTQGGVGEQVGEQAREKLLGGFFETGITEPGTLLDIPDDHPMARVFGSIGSSVADQLRERRGPDLPGLPEWVRDALDVDALETVGDAAPGAAGAAAPFVGPAVFGLSGIAWYLASKHGDGAEAIVREEFRNALTTDLRELSPAAREAREAESGLEPQSLLLLNHAASGDRWREIQQIAAEVETAASEEDLDAIEAELRAEIDALDEAADWAKLAVAPKIYETLGEFERRLYETPDYVPPGCTVNGPGDRPSGGGLPSLGGSTVDDGDRHENATAALVDLLTGGDESRVVLVSGESGIGKSRLLAEAGAELGDDRAVRYADAPVEPRPPDVDDDTVVFVDELGSTDHPEYFLGLADPTNRADDGDHRVDVVAAVRPVHERAIDDGLLPTTVDRYDLALDRLDESGTTALTADAVSPERARSIHDATDGNPFLSRLLVRAEDGADPQRVFATVVDERMLGESTALDAGGERTARLLRAAAVLGEYRHLDDRERVADLFEMDDEPAGEHVTRLVDHDNVSGLDAATGPACTHEVDVFAEYLRFQTLADYPYQYECVVHEYAPERPVPVARGLVELTRSSLARFEFFGADDVEPAVRDLLGTLATRVVESDVGTDEMVRTLAEVAHVAPERIPNEAALSRLDHSGVCPDTVEAGALLAKVLYIREAPVAARKWLDRLTQLVDGTDGPGVRRPLAQVLANSVAHEGDAEHLDEMRDRLCELTALVATDDDPDLCLRLATGLANGGLYEGAHGNVDRMAERLAELREVTRGVGGAGTRSAQRGLTVVVDWERDDDDTGANESREQIEDPTRLGEDGSTRDEIAIRTVFAHVFGVRFCADAERDDLVDRFADVSLYVSAFAEDTVSPRTDGLIDDVTRTVESLIRTRRLDALSTVLRAVGRLFPDRHRAALSERGVAAAERLLADDAISTEVYRRAVEITESLREDGAGRPRFTRPDRSRR